MTLGPDSDAHSRFREGYMKFHRSQKERAKTDLKRPNVKTTFCSNYSGGTSDFSGSVLRNIFQHLENGTGKTKRDCTRFPYACPCLCSLPCPCSSKKSSRRLCPCLSWREPLSKFCGHFKMWWFGFLKCVAYYLFSLLLYIAVNCTWQFRFHDFGS